MPQTPLSRLKLWNDLMFASTLSNLRLLQQHLWPMQRHSLLCG